MLFADLKSVIVFLVKRYYQKSSSLKINEIDCSFRGGGSEYLGCEKMIVDTFKKINGTGHKVNYKVRQYDRNLLSVVLVLQVFVDHFSLLRNGIQFDFQYEFCTRKIFQNIHKKNLETE